VTGEPLPVSVVIPAYNRPDMVRQAVASALDQRPRPPAEVVMVDDCSSDDTGAAAAEAGARVIRHEQNRGEGGARNTGFAEARNEWVALLDCDDEWLPQHLDRIWPLRDGHVLVSGSCVARGEGPEDGRVQGPASDAPKLLRSPAAVVQPMNFVPPSAVMLRRAAVLAAGGFDPGLKMAADLDLWIRVLERGTGVASPEVTAIYRLHGGQVSQDRKAMEDAHLDVLARYRGRSWCTPGLIRRREGIAAWDGLRRDLRARRRARGLARFALALADPRRAAGVVESLEQRRRIRRQSASLGGA
jgi:glycosyltransferase involved in cell wall biosynthesis